MLLISIDLQTKTKIFFKMSLLRRIRYILLVAREVFYYSFQHEFSTYRKSSTDFP